MVRRQKIRELVDGLLAETNVREAPVPVRELARLKGARIVVDSLEGDLSGFLYRDGQNVVIGINTQHAPVRQTFTVAHELAHLLLHGREKQLHVDHAFRVVHLRSDVSSQGIDDTEKEANFFAAELLMPESFLRHDLKAMGTRDLNDDDFIPKLARKYGVSTQALMYRLQHLGYVQG